MIKLLNDAKITHIKLMGYFEGRQTTRQISLIVENSWTEDDAKAICKDVLREIYYNTNKNPFGESKTRRFTTQIGKNKFRTDTTLHFKAFVEKFKKLLNAELKAIESLYARSYHECIIKTEKQINGEKKNG